MKCDAEVVKIVGDATIVFPLLVAATGISNVERVANKSLVAGKASRRAR